MLNVQQGGRRRPDSRTLLHQNGAGFANLETESTRLSESFHCAYSALQVASSGITSSDEALRQALARTVFR